MGPVTNGTINTLAGFNQFIEGNDYVVFRNVTVGAGGTITFWYNGQPVRWKRQQRRRPESSAKY